MKWLTAPAPNAILSTGLFVVRLAMGTAFILHGLPKIQNATGWMDSMELSFPIPGWLQALAAVTEVAGGGLLLLGLLTRLAALGLVCQMVAALALVHIPHGDPFVAVGKSSSELAIVYLSLSLLVIATGPGAWSVDELLTRWSEQPINFSRPAATGAKLGT